MNAKDGYAWDVGHLDWDDCFFIENFSKDSDWSQNQKIYGYAF